MGKGLISVIVPVYNVERFLPECIESICNQTYKYLEIILINDGSTDKCGDICNYFSHMDSRIKVVHKENGGLSSARNAGLKIAAGEYIGFVDGDDFINEHMYEILHYQATIHSSDIVICDFLKVSEERIPHIKPERIEIEKVKHYTNLEACHQIYMIDQESGRRNDVRWIIICNKLFRSHLFRDLQFTEGKTHEDELIAHEILYKAKRVTYLPKYMYYYVQSRNSIMRSPFSPRKFDIVYALKERTIFFRRENEIELYHKAAKHYMEVFFKQYYNAKIMLPNAKLRLKEYKRNNNLLFMINNPLISRKHKIFITLFTLFPKIYDRNIEQQSSQ